MTATAAVAAATAPPPPALPYTPAPPLAGRTISRAEWERDFTDVDQITARTAEREEEL